MKNTSIAQKINPSLRPGVGKVFTHLSKGVNWLVLTCCLVLVICAPSYAVTATCNTNTSGEGSSAGDGNTVLMLASTLADSTGSISGDLCTSLEAIKAAALNLNVEIDDDATWGAKTQAHFASYLAIILGDANCPSETAEIAGDAPVAAAIANGSTWGPAITGPVAIIGTDPVYHYLHDNEPVPTVTANLIENAIALAVSTPGNPGAYVCLSCYYELVNESTQVNVLEPFGSFSVIGAEGSNNANILVPTHPLVNTPNTLDNAGLSNWSSSVHEVFDTFPPSFTAVVQSVELSEPYMLARTGQPPQTHEVTTDPTPFDFNGGPDGGGYSFTAQLSSGPAVEVVVTPILKTQAECNLLVQAKFPGAQCFVYNNSDGQGGHSAVMFEVTCPSSPNNECGSDTAFDAELGSEYVFDKALNPNYRANSDQNPLPGWLKGEPTDTVHPCNPNPSNTPPLFQSNQIKSFVVVGDPRATTKGNSGGTGSCWVATYNTPNVTPSVSVTTPVNNASYALGANVPSNFTCTPVNTLTANPNSPTGPYLTVPSTPAPGCTASVDSGAPITPGTPINTSSTGPHTFVATVLDSGSDTKVTQIIHYTVAGAATLNISPSSFNLGTIYMDKNPKQTFTVTNNGSGPLKFTKVAITPGTGPGAKDFKTQNNSCSGTLAPGHSCTVTVVFNDDHVGTSTATLLFYDNAAGSPQGVPLSGTVINPKLSLSPSSVSFGTHKVNSTSNKTVVLKNTGTTTLTLTGIVVGGSNAADFTTGGCSSGSLTAGNNCNLTVTFKPHGKGSRSAMITITDNAANSPQKVTLSGTGN